MLQTATIDFLSALAENNNKSWFDANRKSYEAAKADFEQLVGALLEDLLPVIPELEGQKAKDCIFRIFRDVRFSKNKEPYKANFGAAFGKNGKKVHSPGYYLHIQPGGQSFIAGGLWMPENNLLKLIRQEIDYNYDELTGILKDKQFKKYFKSIEGESLKKVPQGYTEDNPAIELLKKKSFIVSTPLSDKEITGKNLRKSLTELMVTMKPFILFLEHAMEI